MYVTTTTPTVIAGLSVWFERWTTSTRDAVTEHARFTGDGLDGPEGSYRWINRPWYEFRYQVAQKKAIYGELDRLREIDRRAYLAERGLARMSAKRRAEWQEARREAKYPAHDPSCYGWWVAALWYASWSGKWDEVGARERYIIAHLDHVELKDANGRTVYEFVSAPDETGTAAYYKWDVGRNAIYC